MDDAAIIAKSGELFRGSLTALHLGRLKSRELSSGPSYSTGLDISAISTLYGHSAVIDVNEMECCSE